MLLYALVVLPSPVSHIAQDSRDAEKLKNK